MLYPVEMRCKALLLGTLTVRVLLLVPILLVSHLKKCCSPCRNELRCSVTMSSYREVTLGVGVSVRYVRDRRNVANDGKIAAVQSRLELVSSDAFDDLCTLMSKVFLCFPTFETFYSSARPHTHPIPCTKNPFLLPPLKCLAFCGTKLRPVRGCRILF